MKNLIILTCMLFSISVFAQERTVEKSLEEIQVSPPQFTGIKNAATLLQKSDSEMVKNYLVKNVKYPQSSLDNYEEGTSVIQFTISTEGNLTNFEIINSVSRSIDEEVIKVLKSTNGMWKPGLNNGQPIAMKKEVSMLFKVDETDIDAIMKNFTARAINHFVIASKSLFYKQNAKKALKHYNHATKYLPNDRSLLTMRGLCKYELGDRAGAEKDWNRIIEIAGKTEAKSNLDYLSYDVDELKGSVAMNRILEK